jgi:hypothetical protein
LKKQWISLLLTFVLVFTVLPAYAFGADNYNMEVSVKDNQVTISGGNAHYSGKNLTLRVANNNNENILADQIKADNAGNYVFGPYTLDSGSYTAYVGGVDAPESKAFVVSPTDPVATNANLKSLQLSGVAFSFSADKTDYSVSVGNAVSRVTVSASADAPKASVKINNEAVSTKDVELKEGANLVSVEVTAQDGITKKVYSLTITRPSVQTAASNVSTPVSTAPLSISVPAGTTQATLKVTSAVSGSQREATLPLIEVKAATSLGNVSLAVPDGTPITAPANWNGVINLPELLSNSSVSADGVVSAVIEVGSPDVKLTFDRAVRLLIPNQAGKAAAYVNGSTFTTITKTVSADNQAVADSEIAAGGDAKIDVGSDLVIWTKHFTKFVSYTPASTNNNNGYYDGSAANKDVITSKGGTLNQNGVKITIPAGAVTSDTKVTVEKVTNVSALPMDAAYKLVSDVFEIKKDKADNFNSAISITLPFDKTLVDFDKMSVAVYWLNEQANKWTKLDSQQVDKSAYTATGSVNHFTKFAVLATNVQPVEPNKPKPSAVELTDIKGHWAEQSIKDLIQLGAINGYPDKTFKPNNNITRAEFVSIVINAFGIPAKDGKVFTDTTKHWAKSAITTAAANGIISGYSDKIFGPNENITREQMAQIIVNVTKMKPTSDAKVYKDSSQISSWAKAAVKAATSSGVLGGYKDGTLKPKGNTTRAEAVSVIIRALNLQS